MNETSDARRVKEELRAEMKRRLRAMSAEEKASASRAIVEAIARHSAYLAARVVATFDPLASEPNVGLLWSVAPRRFLYPRIVGETLELVAVDDPAKMAARTQLFREPVGEAADLADVDVILVPGRAFTASGIRLGWGQGHYDRLLEQLPSRVTRIGVCFACQLCAELPAEPHDQRLHEVIAH